MYLLTVSDLINAKSYKYMYVSVCVCVCVYVYILEKEMAAHSSIFAWEIPGTEPGRLQSKGSQRVRHNLVIKQQKYIYVLGLFWDYPPSPAFLKFDETSSCLFKIWWNFCQL